MTTPSTYAIPNVKDFSNKLAGCNIFSSLDLTKAYWQVPVGRSSIPKTAVCTPFSTRNAGSTFQCLIDSVLAGVKNVFVYLNDCLVFSRSTEEHEDAVHEVLARFRAAAD